MTTPTDFTSQVAVARDRILAILARPGEHEIGEIIAAVNRDPRAVRTALNDLLNDHEIVIGHYNIVTRARDCVPA